MYNTQIIDNLKNNSATLKRYALVGVAVVLLIVLIVVLAVSSGKKADIKFDWSINQQQVMDINKNNSTVKSAGKMVVLTDYGIESFKNEKVEVKYYFSGKNNTLSKVVYDVSDCDGKNIKKLIKSFDKKYKRIKSTENTINGSTKQQIRWIDEDTNFFFEKTITAATEDVKGTVTMKFSFTRRNK